MKAPFLLLTRNRIYWEWTEVSIVTLQLIPLQARTDRQLMRMTPTNWCKVIPISYIPAEQGPSVVL